MREPSQSKRCKILIARHPGIMSGPTQAPRTANVHIKRMPSCRDMKGTIGRWEYSEGLRDVGRHLDARHPFYACKKFALNIMFDKLHILEIYWYSRRYRYRYCVGGLRFPPTHRENQDALSHVRSLNVIGSLTSILLTAPYAFQQESENFPDEVAPSRAGFPNKLKWTTRSPQFFSPEMLRIVFLLHGAATIKAHTRATRTNV